MFWGRFWKVRCWAKSLWCFIVGHDIKCEYGYYAQPDWCDRCFKSERVRRGQGQDIQDYLTMPILLNRFYVWLVNHGGEPFYTLDMWLQKHVRLPSWWEY